MNRWIKNILVLSVIIALGIIFFYGFNAHLPSKFAASTHYISEGERETGAINIVSSIYLGYRVFDTLGETVVLLITVSSVIFLFKKGEK